ncbi:MAG: flavin reductase family protein [Alicyclobacillus sp.]|nr:flavin reductase family protein [Alicyclobacillus sp.]
MTDPFVHLTPGDLPWRDSYKLLIGAVVPRPIALVSTVSADGVRNLAAFSFFNGVCPKPLVVAFAPMWRGSDGGKKDTLRNVEETGQFVVNVVSEQIVEQVNRTNPEYPPEVDEFLVSGLTPLDSECIRPPRVAESPVQMECSLLQVVTLGAEIGAGSLVLGRVERMHVRDDVYRDGKIDPDALLAVGRMAGDVYARTRDRFSLRRPTVADQPWPPHNAQGGPG